MMLKNPRNTLEKQAILVTRHRVEMKTGIDRQPERWNALDGKIGHEPVETHFPIGSEAAEDFPHFLLGKNRVCRPSRPGGVFRRAEWSDRQFTIKETFGSYIPQVEIPFFSIFEATRYLPITSCSRYRKLKASSSLQGSPPISGSSVCTVCKAPPDDQ
jgi:hypothetical protein